MGRGGCLGARSHSVAPPFGETCLDERHSPAQAAPSIEWVVLVLFTSHWFAFPFVDVCFRFGYGTVVLGLASLSSVVRLAMVYIPFVLVLPLIFLPFFSLRSESTITNFVHTKLVLLSNLHLVFRDCYLIHRVRSLIFPLQTRVTSWPAALKPPWTTGCHLLARQKVLYSLAGYI